MLPAALACLILNASASAQNAPRWQNGADIYAKVCGYCHDAGVGPVLQGQNLPVEGIIPIVRQGFLAMPAFTESFIDDAALKAVADHIARSPAPSINK